ncbi:MAG: DUF2723 domain-containing protein [Actinomycetota bacterium]|nr:DUF2723 domain-containing protein [Actinomycetota bacterium]
MEKEISIQKGTVKNPDFLISIFIFFLVLLTHITCAARTVTFADSGDFLMGIATMGNVHGPGYPLFLLTAKIFSWIFPFGTLAFRTSIYSGIFAALTACLIYHIVLRITRSKVGSLVAALVYSFSYTFWYQSVIPETYSLNAFFIALLILLTLRWERLFYEGGEKKATNTLCLMAFIYGLALANHITIVFLLPAFIFFIVDTDWKSILAPKNLLRIIVFMILGALPYIYQPVAAFRGPGYNYGDPSTLLRWFRHITLYYQRGGLFTYPSAYFAGRFSRYFGTLNTEFPYVAWIGLFGVVFSFRKRSKKIPLFLVLLFLLSLLPVMTYTQIEPVLRAHFYYPSYLIFSIWIGIGVAYFGRVLRSWSRNQDRIVEIASLSVGFAVALLTIVPAGIIHYEKVDKSNYHFAEDMARRILEITEPESIVLTESDNVFFPCRYMQIVEGIRTDIRVINAESIGAFGFEGLDLLAKPLEPSQETKTQNNLTEVALKNFREKPVYSTHSLCVFKDAKEYWLGYALRVVPMDAEIPERKANTSIRKGVPYMDSDAREAVLMPRALLANYHYSKKEYKRASLLYEEIKSEFEDKMYVPTLYGCATMSGLYELWGECLNAESRYRETLRKLKGATRIDSDFASPAMVEAYMRLGHIGDALIELDKYIAFNPDEVEARIIKGELYLMSEQYEEAARVFEECVSIDSKNARLRYLLGKSYMPLGRMREAKKEFEAVIEIEPSGSLASESRKQLEILK